MSGRLAKANRRLEAALDYAARGWGVFPCKPRDKVPATEHGCKDATTDPEQIARWFGQAPAANVAIATGKGSGLQVLDVDGTKGAESLAALVSRHGALPPTPRARTGGGGLHYFFRWAPGARNSAGKIAPGLDTRADGGYVVAASSVHPNGTPYAWEVDPDDVPLAEPPAWLIEAPAPPSRPAWSRPAPTSPHDGDRGREMLESYLRHSADGTGDNHGVGLAKRLAGNDVPEGEALALLAEYGQRATADPSNPFTERDALRWWRSGCAKPDDRPWESSAPSLQLRAEGRRNGTPAPQVAGPEAPATQEPDAPEAPAKAPDGDRQTVAATLIAIGEEAELFGDERGEPYAAMQAGEGRRVLRVRGSEYRSHLCREFWVREGRAATGEAVAAARGVLEAKALHEGARRELHNRFAHSEGVVWIDLADPAGRAVRVDAGGWEIVAEPPILFRRYAHQAALPIPQRGCDIRRILKYMNLTRKEDRLLLLAWLVTAPLAHIARPILVLHGDKGSAKTTAARMLRSLTDPSAVPVLSLPRDVGETALLLDHHALPILDNLSRIGHGQSDLLCQAVTGGGFTKRALYTDGEDAILSFRRAMIMTGINVAATEPDLLDRCLLMGLDRIPPDKRREEADLWRDFDAKRGALFGGLLTALSGALKVYPTIHLRDLPRLADFARYGAAAAVALGTTAKKFTDALFDAVARQAEEAVEADPVAVALRDLFHSEGEWRGSASGLLELLTDRIGPGAARAEDWPKRATTLARRVHTVASVLREAGVDVTAGRDSEGIRGRWIGVAAVETGKMPTQPTDRRKPYSHNDSSCVGTDTGTDASDASADATATGCVGASVSATQPTQGPTQENLSGSKACVGASVASANSLPLRRREGEERISVEL